MPSLVYIHSTVFRNNILSGGQKGHKTRSFNAFCALWCRTL